MTISSALPIPARPRALPYSILSHALLVGIAGDALLRDHPGMGVPIWTGLLGLALISLATGAGRVVSGQAGGWLLMTVLFSAGLAWRDSETLQFLDGCAVIGGLGMTALSLSDSRAALFAKRLRDTVWGAGAVVISVVAGLAPLGLLAPERRSQSGLRFGSAARATLITATFMLVFGGLLRDADPIFASLVAIPRLDLDAMASHLLFIGFCTWLVGGWARSALVVEVGRHPAPDQFVISLSLLDITAALGTLIVVFTVFVATQLGWFFGGERFLQERTGLTAAEYARGGFFQMVWVVLLVVVVLLATRGMLRPGRSLAHRHTLLSLPVVALLVAIILSAAMRMGLYVHYYGLTTLRLYPLVFMGWLGVVLVWLTVTVLRGWGRPFVAGAALSAMVTLAALNLAAPDAIVARVNLSRAANWRSGPRPELDLVHLASLSGEAAELAVAATLATPPGTEAAGSASPKSQRCLAAGLLLKRWGPSSPAAERRSRDASWRFWNAGEAKAVRVVARDAGRLGAICRP
jgi:hypothetical protein